MIIVMRNDKLQLLKIYDGYVTIIKQDEIENIDYNNLKDLYNIIKNFKPVNEITDIVTPSGVKILYDVKNGFVIYDKQSIIESKVNNNTITLTLDFGTYYENDIDDVNITFKKNVFIKRTFKRIIILKEARWKN